MTGRRTSDQTYQIHVLGPDCQIPSFLDLADLLAAKGLNRQQRERIARLPKVVATQGRHVVGLACFNRVDEEIRVQELFTHPDQHATSMAILRRLLEALELACLASGGHRVLVLPEAVLTASSLEELGYHEMCMRAAGPWLEKSLG